MPSSGVVKPVDVLEDRCFHLSPRWLFLLPDELRLQRFEERLDGRIVIAVAFATHRWPQARIAANTPRRTRRGPVSRLEQQLDAIAKLPKARQKFVSDMLDTVLAQHGTPAGQEAAPA